MSIYPAKHEQYALWICPVFLCMQTLATCDLSFSRFEEMQYAD